MGRHLFLSDIDGTLVRGDIGMTPEVLAAARIFREAGGLLAVCSGRAPVSALPIARQLEVNTPCILYGGAALYDCVQQKVLWSRPFDPRIREFISRAMERCPSISMQVFTTSGIYVLRRNSYFDAHGVRTENIGPIRTLNEVDGDILKLVLCDENRQELEHCRACFPREYCNFAFASRHFVDIVAAGAGKETAMAELSRRLEIPFSAFFCAGDAITDLPMLRLAGTAYAPEDALEPVLEQADLVVPDVAHGGMELAFRHAANMVIASIV